LNLKARRVKEINWITYHSPSRQILDKMKKKIILIMLGTFFLYFFSSPPFALAAKYYVGKNGSDKNPGTENSPWLTIQKAADTLQPGDTVLIRQGIYPEKVRPAKSGRNGMFITYQNYGSEEVIIDAQNGARDACVRVNGKRYLKFAGLKLAGASGSSGLRAAFYATDGSENLILENITATQSRFGILLLGRSSPVSQIIIRNCIVTGNTGHGIFLYRRVYNTAVGPGNRIFSNVGEEYAFGLEIGTDFPGNKADGARNIEVRGNEVCFNGMQGVRTWNAKDILIKGNFIHNNGASGIQIEDGSENVIVEDNRCEYNAKVYEYETGIWIDSTKNAVVRGNIIRGNKIGLMVSDSRRVIVRNNVIVENNQGVAPLVNAMGLNVDANASEVVIVHNTLHRNGAPQSQRGGITVGAYRPPVMGVVLKNNILSETLAPYDLWIRSGDLVSDYNLFYNSRPLNIYWHPRRTTWSDYTETSGQDIHTITGHLPQFISPANSNFRLSPGSPGIDAGGLLTQATSSGSGRVIQVLDASYFTNGLAIVRGDRIQVGSNNPVEVEDVDYEKKILTIDKNISWNMGDGISYPFSGRRPDIGAFEYVRK
jgi:parallel beta-helix repeat protein